MDMSGERRLPAPRDTVWAALNDPAVLRASIPGCRKLEPAGEDGYRATAAVKIGPIRQNFSGEVRLLDLDPPASYRIEGSGQSASAGFAKGSAVVRLSAEGQETLLSYTVTAEVGGKLAQLGARLIDASSKQMADQFFDNFARALSPPPVDQPVDETGNALVENSQAELSQTVPLAGAQPAEALPLARPAPARVLPPPPPAKLNLLALLPETFLGYPRIAWAAAAVFLFIVYHLFGG